MDYQKTIIYGGQIQTFDVYFEGICGSVSKNKKEITYDEIKAAADKKRRKHLQEIEISKIIKQRNGSELM